MENNNMVNSRSLGIRFAFVSLAMGLLTYGQPLKFEVASIKISSAENGAILGLSNVYSVRAVTLRELVRFAYGIDGQDVEITGGPAWVYTTRFDIDAKIPGQPSLSQRNEMLAELLVDRFGLKIRPITSSKSVFELILARGDGKLGPKLRPAMGCESPRPTLPRCIGPGLRPTGFLFRSISMQYLATSLSSGVTGLGRPFIDRTGLVGEFDADFDFRFQVNRQPSLSLNPSDDQEVSFSSALQEQLGLKLRSGKSDIVSLVIDDAHHPSPN